MYRRIRRIVGITYRLTRPVVDLRAVVRGFRGIPRYVEFLKDLREYKRLDPTASIKFRDLYPKIHQKSGGHGLGAHYFYQSAWAFRLIYNSKVKRHVDIASETTFVGLLSGVVEVTFVDIRALDVDLENLTPRQGDILSLPYPDHSVDSLSSLHVIEHIGLGRYGDAIDPEGTRKAASELSRVLAPGGNLYVSVPIGRPKVSFNAHRIHSTSQVVEMFNGLELIEFSAVSDDSKFERCANLDDFDDAEYSCGLFWFQASESRNLRASHS